MQASETLPLATDLVKQEWPLKAIPTGGAEMQWTKVECHAVALRNQGRYDEELNTLDLAAGLLLRDLAQHPNREQNALAVEYLNQLALRMDGAGRPEDAVRLLRTALTLAEHDRKLYEPYYLFTVQLDLAHALAQSGDTAGAAALCKTLAISPKEIRSGHAGNATIAQARKQLFCGEAEAALSALHQQSSALAEPHKILSDYALATHHPEEAAREYALYLHAPEFQSRAATTNAH